MSSCPKYRTISDIICMKSVFDDIQKKQYAQNDPFLRKCMLLSLDWLQTVLTPLSRCCMRMCEWKREKWRRRREMCTLDEFQVFFAFSIELHLIKLRMRVTHMWRVHDHGEMVTALETQLHLLNCQNMHDSRVVHKAIHLNHSHTKLNFEFQCKRKLKYFARFRQTYKRDDSTKMTIYVL